MAEDVVRLLRGAKEFEEKVSRIESQLERDAASIMAAAEERARRLEALAEAIVDRMRERVRRAADEEIARIREEMERKKREIRTLVEVTAQGNFEKAVSAALEVLASAVRVSGR